MEAGIHELTAGYALDALDPDDRRDYEAHLEGCAGCRDELARMWETSEALAVAAAGAEPPAALRERVLAAVREEPQVVVPLAPRRSRAVPVLGALAAAAAVAAVAVGLWGAGVSRDLDDARSALEQERAAAAVLADPDSRSVALQEGEGRLVVGADGQAVLVLDDLGPAPAGRIYEMWIVTHGEDPVRAGLFPGEDGRDVVAVDGNVAAGQVVLVTVEPEGGVDAPTSEPIIGSMPA